MLPVMPYLSSCKAAKKPLLLQSTLKMLSALFSQDNKFMSKNQTHFYPDLNEKMNSLIFRISFLFTAS